MQPELNHSQLFKRTRNNGKFKENSNYNLK